MCLLEFVWESFLFFLHMSQVAFLVRLKKPEFAECGLAVLSLLRVWVIGMQ